MNNTSLRPRLLTGLLALSLFCFPALSQESRGSIQGRVTDPSDAPVAIWRDGYTWTQEYSRSNFSESALTQLELGC